MPTKAEGVERATGRNRAQWFALLDRWGAPGRDFREIAAWLMEKHGVSRWWAQKLIVEYEQERGLRAPGVRRDGTFEVTASKTVATPVERLFEAFVDSRRRSRWLAEHKMKVRSSTSPRSARFEWDGGPTRVTVDFAAKGSSKSVVSVAHQLLPDEATAAQTKSEWRARLNDLKTYLES